MKAAKPQTPCAACVRFCNAPFCKDLDNYLRGGEKIV